MKFELKGEVGEATAEGAGVNVGLGGGRVSQERVRRQAALSSEKEALETGSCAEV